MAIQRGDIYRVNLEPTIGSEQQGNARPCVVLSVSAFNNKLRTIGVVPLSLSPRPCPRLSSLRHPPGNRLRRRCAANCGRLISTALLMALWDDWARTTSNRSRRVLSTTTAF